MTPWEVAVVGGGLAGTTAATLLARQGRKVILLEKERRAHHKVCGEFLSIEAQEFLQLLGVDIQALGAVFIEHVTLSYGNRTVTCPLPFKAASLSRKVLDNHLVTVAERSGVVIKRGCFINTTVWKQSAWLLSALLPEEVIEANTIFLATGKHEMPTVSPRKGSQNQFIGFKLHYKLTEAQSQALQGGVELALFKGGYAGLELIEGGLANLCLIVDKSYFLRCGKTWPSFLKVLMQEAPIFSARLAGAIPCWSQPLALSCIPYGFVYRPQKKEETPHCFRLGDQMGVIPSFCGDGMSIAFYTGFQAAQHYLTSTAAVYHQKMSRVLSPQIQLASFLSNMASQSFTQKMIFDLCHKMPFLLPQVASLTRLPQKYLSH